MSTLLYDIARCPGVPNEPDEPPGWPKAKVGDDVKILLQYKSIQQRSMTNE